MSRSERQAQQLGMSHGAAANRLRKNILFSFAKRLGEDVCFKCHKCIETVEELSIEHKQPWENKSADLFWDLENIAFSHIQCNRPHTFSAGNPNVALYAPKKTKEAPEGTAWCTGHQDYLLIEAFHANQRNVNGVASYCKECRKIRLD